MMAINNHFSWLSGMLPPDDAAPYEIPQQIVSSANVQVVSPNNPKRLAPHARSTRWPQTFMFRTLTRPTSPTIEDVESSPPFDRRW